MLTDSEKIYEKLTTFHSEFTEFRGEVKAAALHTIAARIGIIKG